MNIFRLQKEMYSRINDLFKKYSKEFTKISGKFDAELKRLIKAGEKLTSAKKTQLWKRSGYQKHLNALRKKLSEEISSIRKTYETKIKKLKKA